MAARPSANGPPLEVEQRVKVSGRFGTVKFYGETKFAEGTWVGIALDEKVGKNDGCVKGEQYFTCPPNHGIFVKPGNVELPGPDETPPKAAGAAQEKAAAPTSKSPAKAPAKATAETAKSPAKASAETPKSPAEASPKKAGAPKTKASPAAKTPTPSKEEPPSPKAPPRRESKLPGADPSMSAEMKQELTTLGEEYKQLKADFEKGKKELEDLRQKPKAPAKESSSAEQDPRAAELQKEIAKEKEVEEKLKKELDAVSSRVQELANQKEELELPEGSSPESISLLKRLEAAKIRRELVQLQADEVELDLENKREEWESVKADAAAEVGDDPERLTEDEKAAIHREALQKIYEEHLVEMRVLRTRVADLERAHERLGGIIGTSGTSPEELEAMNKTIEQLTDETGSQEATANNIAQVLDTRRGLRQLNSDLTQEEQELENTLKEEIEYQFNRTCQLEALSLDIKEAREDAKKRQKTHHAAVSRLEVRLQSLQAQVAQRKAEPILAEAEPEAPSVKDLENVDVDIALVSSAARADAAKADAWAACLPDALREEAELGDSFNTLCALHRCFHKSQILSSSITQHYIENAAFAVQSGSAKLMEWFCRTCLASTQVAFSAAGILGRMRAYDVDRYHKVVRLPAIRASVNAESALDAALAVLGAEGQTSNVGPPEIITSLGALTAQLLSLQSSAFKEEPFASWQSAGFAVETIRAVCCLALYASEDAGGSKRKSWQALHARSDKLAKRLRKRSLSGGLKPLELMDVQMAISAPQAESASPDAVAENPADESPTDDTPNEERPQESAPSSQKESAEAGDPFQANLQSVLENLLLQVSALETHSMREPNPDDRAGDALDRAFNLANAGLETIEEANRDIKEADDNVASASDSLPWVQARRAMQTQIEAAEKSVTDEKKVLDDELKRSNEALVEYETNLEKVKEEFEQIGKVYSAARIDAERFDLISTTVARLRSQAEFHDAKQKELTDECQKEDDMRKSVKKETTDNQKRCEELQQQLTDYERRMQKKFSHNVSPEDVIALRQTCARQHREIISHHGTTAASKPGSLQKALTTPFTGMNVKSLKELTPQWQTLQEVQTNLLLEHASTSIVDLTDPGAKNLLQEQRTRLEGLSQKTADLKHGVTGLLRSLAGADENGGGKQSATVALTRHLKATSEAAARGTMAKVVMPMTGHKQVAAKVPSPHSVSVSADFDLLQSLHHAVF